MKKIGSKFIVTAIVLEFLDFESFNAAIVSAVSPDWLMKIHNVLSLTIGDLYLNSDATSTSTGILHRFSMNFFPVREQKQKRLK